MTQRILQIAEEQARSKGGTVAEIRLVVGDYSGYMADCIQLYFDILAAGTRSENARLIIRRVEPKLRCTHCHQLFKREPFSFACPACGGDGEPTEIGREFYVESVVLDTDPAGM